MFSIFRRVPRAASPKPPRAQLSLDALESREVPATFQVTTTGDNAADPTTLRGAIQLANTTAGADTITFALPGGSTINLTNGDLIITGSLTIDGPGLSVTGLTIKAAANQRVFNIQSQGSIIDVTIQDMTLLGNGDVASQSSGGIIQSNGNLTLRDVQVNNGGSGAVANNTLFGQSPVLNIFASSFVGSRRGPAISAVRVGTIQNSTIANNTGGAFNIGVDGNSLIQNNTVSGNSADNNFSGLFLTGTGAARLVGNILFGNTRTGFGALDLVGDGNVISTSSQFNIVGAQDGKGILRAGPGNQIGVDPLLGPLAANVRTSTQAFVPTGNSPARDRMPAGTFPTTDQAGDGRNEGGDIGSIEASAGSLVATTGGGSAQTNQSVIANLRAVFAQPIPRGSPILSAAITSISDVNNDGFLDVSAVIRFRSGNRVIDVRLVFDGVSTTGGLIGRPVFTTVR